MNEMDDLLDSDAQYWCDDHLRNAHAWTNIKGLMPEIDQDDAYFTSVSFVNRSRGIQKGDAVLHGKAAPWPHLRFRALGKLHDKARRDKCTRAWLNRQRGAGANIHSRIAGVGIRRNGRFWMSLLKLDSHVV